MPFVPIQLLWLNLVTDSFPALALGVEKGDEDIHNKRAEQALAVKPEVIVTACPFCNTMLTDGVKNQQKTIIPVMDIALLIEQAEDL